MSYVVIEEDSEMLQNTEKWDGSQRSGLKVIFSTGKLGEQQNVWNQLYSHFGREYCSCFPVYERREAEEMNKTKQSHDISQNMWIALGSLYFDICSWVHTLKKIVQVK